MSFDETEDSVEIDPELRMEDAEDLDDDEEDTSAAAVKIEEQQREFVLGVQTLIEPLIIENPEHRTSIETTAEGILGLIEGNGRDEGYILVKRTHAELAMVPCTRQVYEEHLRDFVDDDGLDISVGLSSMFNDVNN
jgi:hypothetical protein